MPLDLPRSPSAEPSADSDAGLLDAYSRAVTAAVAHVAPAVAHVKVERARATPGAVAGAGSGFLITPDGYLVTNSHVASGASTIEITLSDGRAIGAHIVGDDPDSDLAVLKVAAGNLPWSRFGDSTTLQVGRLRLRSEVLTDSSTR